MNEIYKGIIDRAVQGQSEFHGVVSLSDLDGQRAVYTQGLAERGFGVPVNEETRFGIASGTKGFTAIRILQLIEEGKLSLNSRLTEILPETFEKVTDDVTIENVLMHMSGMPDYFDEETMEDFSLLWEELPMYKVEKPSDLLPLYANQEMMFKAGEKFQYNNGGFIALGLVIEAMTNTAYDESVTQNVFKKANMDTAGFDRFDSLKQNTAVGYIENEKDNTWKSNIYALPVKGSADGGAFVNASDMESFWRGMLEKKVINDESFSYLDKHHVHVSKNIHYSLGFWTKRDDAGLECIYLMGEDPGVSFMSVCYPRTGIFYTILANTKDGAWDIHFNMYEEVLKLK